MCRGRSTHHGDEPLITITPVPNAPEPASVFRCVADRPHVLWLDSARTDHPLGRHSFVGVDPFLLVRARGCHVECTGPSGTKAIEADPFAVLGEVLSKYTVDPVPGVPFVGGAAGSFGYGLAGSIEAVSRPPSIDPSLTDLELALYDSLLWWDHHAGTCHVVSTGLPETGRAGRDRAGRRTDILLELVHETASSVEDPGPAPECGVSHDDPPAPLFPVPGHPGIRSTFTRDAYMAAVSRAVEYVHAGDVFQVNLSQRLQGPLNRKPADVYLSLRRRNPAPFGAFFGARNYAIASTSPERFLELDGARVETRPIKGTRPRTTDPDVDGAFAAELFASEKDRAENLMIVDLLRNDLSRVCRPSSVRVESLFDVESFATVHHLVSTVSGMLEPTVGAVDLIRACFPSGSVTGAPKIRAMEIISELEPVERGPYCGAIGYIGFDGRMDTSVAIRTMLLRDGIARFHVGGGVVADSEPAAEYEETLDKAAGLIAGLEEGQ